MTKWQHHTEVRLERFQPTIGGLSDWAVRCDCGYENVLPTKRAAEYDADEHVRCMGGEL